MGGEKGVSVEKGTRSDKTHLVGVNPLPQRFLSVNLTCDISQGTLERVIVRGREGHIRSNVVVILEGDGDVLAVKGVVDRCD